METMGDRILAILKARGIKKIQMASDLAVSPASVSFFCQNKTNPSKQTIALMCQKYGVSKEWLMTGEGEMFDSLDKEAEIGIMVSTLNGIEKASAKYQLIKLLMSADEDDLQKALTALKTAIEETGI